MSYDHVRKAYLPNILAQQVLSRKKEMFLSLFLWEEAWNIGIYMPLSTVNYFTKIPITTFHEAWEKTKPSNIAIPIGKPVNQCEVHFICWTGQSEN